MATTIRKVVDGTEIDVALLENISLKRLLENDADEAKKLYNASASPGFFYLDVRGSEVEQHVADVQQLYAITERYFTQPEDVKMKDFVKDDEFRGYKPGKMFGSFEILQDDLANNEGLPEIIQPDATTIHRLISHSQRICNTLIARLSDSLWPNNPSIRLEDKHLRSESSNSSLKLYRGPLLEKRADVGDNKHTDGGTFTLFHDSDKWGTQIQLRGGDNEEWGWVEPMSKHGRVLVNVGDSLQKVSGGRLRSCIHRVSQVADGFEERWVAAYFFRPSNGASLDAL